LLSGMSCFSSPKILIGRSFSVPARTRAIYDGKTAFL
jgi:hypothetical protein